MNRLREYLKNSLKSIQIQDEDWNRWPRPPVGSYGLRADLRQKMDASPALCFDEMEESTVPWEDYLALIQPVYHESSSKGGRPPIPFDLMLRIHVTWTPETGPG